MKLPGVEVVLLHGLSGARRRWCGEFTAAQRTCAGGEKQKVWLGFGHGGCDGDEAQRAAGCDIKQAGGIWASVPLSTRARISPGISGERAR